MWISKKKFKALEKRIADLEVQIQSQQGNNFVSEDSDGNKYYSSVSKEGS